MLAVTNWSGEPLATDQGTRMGSVQEVEFVSQDDPVSWRTHTCASSERPTHSCARGR